MGKAQRDKGYPLAFGIVISALCAFSASYSFAQAGELSSTTLQRMATSTDTMVTAVLGVTAYTITLACIVGTILLFKLFHAYAE